MTMDESIRGMVNPWTNHVREHIHYQGQKLKYTAPEELHGPHHGRRQWTLAFPAQALNCEERHN